MTDLQDRVVPAAPTVTEFVCNGSTVRVGDHPHLLAALREELGLIAAKDGCSPSGQCGCCTVLLNGKARVACQIPLSKAQGAEIVTPEGLSAEERHRYAAAFGAAGAVQCGFCTPGIVMRVKALIERNGANLTREQASRHLGAHLCRCNRVPEDPRCGGDAGHRCRRNGRRHRGGGRPGRGIPHRPLRGD